MPMSAALAVLSVVAVTTAQLPLEARDDGADLGSRNRIMLVAQNSGGAGGRGGDGNQPILCYQCTIAGPTGGGGGPGGNNQSGGSSKESANKIPTPEIVSMSIARCSLTIAGEKVVDAKGCMYEKVGQRFTVTAKSSNGKYIYRMALALNSDQTGTGSLSGGNSVKTRDLGTLLRQGPCWGNDTVKICAWK